MLFEIGLMKNIFILSLQQCVQIYAMYRQQDTFEFLLSVTV